MENTVLFNMNVPIDIKESFKKVCQLKCRSMSHTLVEMMSKYIIEEGDRVKKDIEKIKEIEMITKKIDQDRVKRKQEYERTNFFQGY